MAILGYLTSLLSALSLLCILTSTVHADVFTAMHDFEKVLVAENNIAKELKNYIAKEETRLHKLKSIADDYERHAQQALANPEEHLANPLNAYLLVKRFTTDWDRVVDEYVRGNSTDDFMSSISGVTCFFPDDEDLRGAASGLMRLQDVYALPTDKLARGEIQGVKNSPELSAEDCFELGRQAYSGRDYYHTVLWMQETMDRLEKERPPTVEKVLVLDYLSFAVSMQGNAGLALNLTIEWLKIEPDHVRAQNNKKYYEQIIQEEEEEKKKKGDEGKGDEEDEVINQRPTDEYRSSDEFSRYEKLCRGEKVENTDKFRDVLTCQYKRHDPMFYINPLKEEVISLEPRIAVFHDVITNKEINTIKEYAIPRLHRSGVFGDVLSLTRISKSAWLEDDWDPILRRVSLRSAALANLTLDSVEQLQVLNYGIGGHYEPHFDWARPNEYNTFEEWRGNRVATVIYYLSDVEAGGGTVFTPPGIKITAKKGAAGVWYNLLRNGEGDVRNRHAACPVLTGTKWVVTKWFHERGQEFIRPCSLNPEE